MNQHDREILEAALIGFEHQKAAIDAKIQTISAELSGSREREVAASTEPAKKKRRKFSAETRKRMAAAQQKRWAAKQKL